MEMDLHHQVKAAVALDSQTISTDTTTNGNVIDTLDFESLEFLVLSGAITDGTYTLLLEESDEVTFGGEETAVPADQILGDTVDFVAADDDAVRRIGSIGKKRFQRLSIVSTGTTSGGVFAALAVLGHPRNIAVAEQAT